MKNFENLDQVLNDPIDESYIKYIASIYFDFDYKQIDNDNYVFVSENERNPNSILPDPFNNIHDLQEMIKVCIDNFLYAKRLVDILVIKSLKDKMDLFKLYESITPEIIVRACALAYYLSEFTEQQVLDFYKESGIENEKIVLINFLYGVNDTCNVIMKAEEKIEVNKYDYFNRNMYEYWDGYGVDNYEYDGYITVDGKEYYRHKGKTYELDPDDSELHELDDEYDNYFEERDNAYYEGLAQGLMSLNVEKDENDPGFLADDWEDEQIFNSHDFVEK